MGTVKRIIDADYSEDNVGKFDFKNLIFRRRINEMLERNYLALNGGTVDGLTPVDLSNRFYTVRSFFTYARHSGDHRVFSVADYTNKRSFNVSHAKYPTYLVVQFWFLVGTNTYNYNVNVPIDVEAIVDIDCECLFDFETFTIKKIEINGSVMPIPTRATGTNAEAWTLGQTRTICFGEVANYKGGVSRAFPYFGQILDESNNVLLHFDFLGDNDAEILTDKARLIQLQNLGPATIGSRPLPL